MVSIEEILSRVDLVIKENKRIEWTYIALTVILFCTGISCFFTALITGQLAWSTPSAITTGFFIGLSAKLKIFAKKISPLQPHQC